MEDENRQLGGWRAARRPCPVGFLWYYFITAQLPSYDSENPWDRLWKEVPVSALDYLHHQPVKFQSWHLLSFTFCENFCLWPWGQLAEYIFLLPLSLSLFLKRSGLCFYFAECRSKSNAINKCCISPITPGIRNQQVLGSPRNLRSSLPSALKSGTQICEGRKALDEDRKEDFHFNIALSKEQPLLLFFREKGVVTITILDWSGYLIWCGQFIWLVNWISFWG